MRLSNNMFTVKSTHPTIDNIYSLPNDKCSELISEVLYNMTLPNPLHQELVMELSATIRNYIKNKKGACKVFPAPFAVFIKSDKENYVEPDISVVCNKDKISSPGCEGVPDFIIKIVSTSSRKLNYS